MRDVPITNRQVWWLAFEAALGSATVSPFHAEATVTYAMSIADEAVAQYKNAEVNK